MSIIQLMEANCRNCYKCIRECPVKSISFNGEQAQIVGDECVLCGHCLQVCPQHAKQIRSQVDKVQELIDRGNKVYVSLAPSYPSYFKGVSLAQMSAALKALGVTQVEETAVGAARVSEEYERLMRQHEMKNIITTACPTVVLLVEKYYPELVPYLAPVASPLLAHAKTMKQVYGPRIKVVFVGPCISKKHDVEDPANEGLVSVALSFEELEQWMALKGVRFGAENPDQRGLRKPVARFYPEPGGILKTIDADVRATYKSVAADGMDRCMRALEAMRSGEMEGFFLELNACEGACIGGPSLSAANFFTSKELLGASIAATDQAGCYLSDETQADIRKRYHDLSPVKRMPTEAQIKEILASIGKTRPEDELNCGGCGYPSCREKAVAVFQGKADAQMCLPYMRQKAESMSNIVLQNTPSYIFILDEALIIQEANPAATAMLKMSREELIGRHIDELLPSEVYYQLDYDDAAFSRTCKQAYPQYGVILEQTLVYVPDNKAIVLIFKDITEEEKREEEDRQRREGTIAITQKVIDKQMRVAQEIASLLGETTAETKVALTKLKKSMGGGDGK